MAKKIRIGFLGFGNMAQAMSRALGSATGRAAVKAVTGRALELWAYDTDREKLGAAGINAFFSAESLVAGCDLVVLSVKPQAAGEAMRGLSFSGKVVLSIMAGVTVAALRTLSGGTADKLVRAMPNMNARVAASCTAYCQAGLSTDEAALVRAVLTAFGDAREVDEDKMDTVTGLGGSGPAFVFSFIQGLIDAGVAGGLSLPDARAFALQTVIGSAYLMESDPTQSADTLIDAVCSKGGTTIEGINYLNEQGFRSTVAGAVGRAAARAAEMAKENERG